MLTLFKNFGEAYYTPIIKLSRSILRDTMSRFEALDVFYNRTIVVFEMKKDLTAALEKYEIVVDNF